jgi:hypothetical protein
MTTPQQRSQHVIQAAPDRRALDGEQQRIARRDRLEVTYIAGRRHGDCELQARHLRRDLYHVHGECFI